MEPVACGQCGKCDDAKNMFVCSGCFEIHFCSVEHFNQHPHSKIEDALHFDPSDEIGPNIRRVLSTGKYKEGLVALKSAFVQNVKDGKPIETRNIISLLMTSVSKKRREDFRETWNLYFQALESTTQESDYTEAVRLLTKPSIQLIDLWASENRLSFRQTRKAIENAWSYFNQLLMNYLYSTPEVRGKAEIEIDQAIPSIAKVLGGGKSNI